MGNRDRGQSNGLHAPICVYERVQLDLHLTGLRSMEHSFVMVPFDILLDEKGQLKRQPQASVVRAFEPLGEQIAVLGQKGCDARVRVDGCARDDGGAPVRAQVVLGGVENGDQDPDDAFRVRPFRVQGVGGGVVAAGQKRPREVADRGDDDGEVVATVPETIVRGLVPEDLVDALVSEW